MNGDRLIELVNLHRAQLQRETELCCEAATVAQYLVLSFARVRSYRLDMAREAFKNAKASGFYMVRPQ